MKFEFIDFWYHTFNWKSVKFSRQTTEIGIMLTRSIASIETEIINTLICYRLILLTLVASYLIIEGPSCSWSYGSWIYTYLCNQCLSPLKLWVRIPVIAVHNTKLVWTLVWPKWKKVDVSFRVHDAFLEKKTFIRYVASHDWKPKII